MLEWFPCPPPGDLPYPGIQPASLMSFALAGGFLTSSTTWEALCFTNTYAVNHVPAGLCRTSVWQAWIRHYAEAEAPILWPPDVKN